jgi:hypothetical protein
MLKGNNKCSDNDLNMKQQTGIIFYSKHRVEPASCFAFAFGFGRLGGKNGSSAYKLFCNLFIDYEVL